MMKVVLKAAKNREAKEEVGPCAEGATGYRPLRKKVVAPPAGQSC